MELTLKCCVRMECTPDNEFESLVGMVDPDACVVRV